MSGSINIKRIGAALVATCVVLGLILAVSAPSASAQAVNCQYNPGQCNGNGNEPGDGNGNNPGNDNGSGNNSGANPATGSVSGANNGTLPFTGYPLSPLVMVLLILLLAGLALRAYVAVRDRLTGHQA